MMEQVLRQLVGLPVCWAHGHLGIESFQAHKLKRISESTRTILFLQSFRSPLLDAIMRSITFCGEEEFYLIFLPCLFWMNHFKFGLHLTLLVCEGFLWGNLQKDIFELPRPQDKKIWRPHENVEFGFPSTHAMNAVSNMLLTYDFFYSKSLSLYGSLAGMAASVTWISLLCLSRMYLGMHSGTDIRGGLLLGGQVFFLHKFVVFPLLEQYVWAQLSLQGVVALSFSLASLLLSSCPHPRTHDTPSFAQNGLIVGILLGIVVGKKYIMSIPGLEYELETESGSIAKAICGFVVLACVRQGAKTTSQYVVRQLGLDNQDNRRLSVAIVKVLTYFCSALWIGVGCSRAWKAMR